MDEPDEPAVAFLEAETGQLLPIIVIHDSRGVLIGRGGEADRADAASAGLDYVYVGPAGAATVHPATPGNGVCHNDREVPIGPHAPVELAPGDRIHLVKHINCPEKGHITYVFRLGQPPAPPRFIPPPPADEVPRRHGRSGGPTQMRYLYRRLFPQSSAYDTVRPRL